MTVGEWANFLQEFGADIGPGVELESVPKPSAELLPEKHLELLFSVNGVTVYHGGFRLFGISRREPMLDIVAWNSEDTWKFAWDDRVEPFLIFGETAWGDQYAYKRNGGHALGSEVYLLESTLLRSQVIAGSFEEFIEDVFIRSARDPYDELTVQVVNLRGRISVDKHWAYMPSIALGGIESADNATELPAITAMIFAGDIASALQASKPGTWPTGVEVWMDEVGRERLAVEFA